MLLFWNNSSLADQNCISFNFFLQITMLFYHLLGLVGSMNSWEFCWMRKENAKREMSDNLHIENVEVGMSFCTCSNAEDAEVLLSG